MEQQEESPRGQQQRHCHFGTAAGDSAAGPDVIEKYNWIAEAFGSQDSRLSRGRHSKNPHDSARSSTDQASVRGERGSSESASTRRDGRSETSASPGCRRLGSKGSNSSRISSAVSVETTRSRKEGRLMRCIRPRGRLGYFCWCFVTEGIASVTTIILWSHMGFGDLMLAWFMDHDDVRLYAISAFLTVFAGLFVFDFFCPPHLPGKYFRLWEDDVYVGRFIFCFGLALVVLSLWLFASVEPSVPLTVTLCLGPVGVIGIWLLFPGVVVADPETDQTQAREIVQKMQVLHDILDSEVDEVQFYKGALAAFMLCGIAVMVAWLVWVIQGNTLESYTEGGDPNDHHIILILWVTPLFVAISNFMFGLFALLRVALHQSYSHTNDLRNSILVDILRGLKREIRSRKAEDKEAAKALERELRVFENMQLNNKHRLQTIMKVVVCSLAMLLGLIFVMGRLVYANSKLTGVIMELAAVFLCGFLAFAYVSFRRIVMALGASLQELRAYKIILAVLQKEWPRALAICFVAPAVPFVLLLSAITKAIRRCRGIEDHHHCRQGSSGSSWVETEEMPIRRALLTPKVVHIWESTYKWSWTSTCFWCYVASGVYVLCTLSPMMLNIGLAWLNKQMSGFPFGVIISILFSVGIVTFMLPPVPGAVVYLFGGLVLADTCPWGFWPGSFINILLCLLMKLCACAVQQKCIGEMLGRRMWVRQAVGVHRMGIRCVESILKRPGWSWGKVAILCGGPDWPTSVLAGILGLSLVQCEVATLPILGFIAPCALTGSLYIKRGTTELWTRVANLMIGLSGLVSLTLIVTIAWALQCELDEHISELARPLKENVHLHWLDHRASEIKRRSAVSWADLPSVIRWLYAFGALLHIAVFHAFLWGFQSLFGTFNVTDSIDDLKVAGPGGLLNGAGLGVMGAYAVGWVCYVSYNCFQRAKAYVPKHEAMLDLDAQEALWKERWLRDLENGEYESERERARAATTTSTPSLKGGRRALTPHSEEDLSDFGNRDSREEPETFEEARLKYAQARVEDLEEARMRGNKAEIMRLEETVAQLRSMYPESEAGAIAQEALSIIHAGEAGHSSRTGKAHQHDDLESGKDSSEQVPLEAAPENSLLAATTVPESEVQGGAEASDLIMEIITVSEKDEAVEEAVLVESSTPQQTVKGRDPESGRSTAATDEEEAEATEGNKRTPLLSIGEASPVPTKEEVCPPTPASAKSSAQPKRKKSKRVTMRWSASSANLAPPCPPQPAIPRAPPPPPKNPQKPSMSASEAAALVDPHTEFAVSVADTLPMVVRIPPLPRARCQ